MEPTEELWIFTFIKKILYMIKIIFYTLILAASFYIGIVFPYVKSQNAQSNLHEIRQITLESYIVLKDKFEKDIKYPIQEVLSNKQ